MHDDWILPFLPVAKHDPGRNFSIQRKIISGRYFSTPGQLLRQSMPLYAENRVTVRASYITSLQCLKRTEKVNIFLFRLLLFFGTRIKSHQVSWNLQKFARIGLRKHQHQLYTLICYVVWFIPVLLHNISSYVCYSSSFLSRDF